MSKLNLKSKGVISAMNFQSLVRAAVLVAVFLSIAVVQTNAQDQSAPQPATGTTVIGTKLAVIDIDRIAAESEAGKVLFEKLKVENDRIAAERAKKQQDIRDMEARMTSEVLSADARAQLSRDVERARTDAQRWLEDQQRDFQQKQQLEEEAFQRQLAPVVEKVAQEHGIGLIFRATPGLTFVLDPNLDITPLVIQAFNTNPPGEDQSQESGVNRN
jgi:Skp family chaperone for outer membrane proteins